MDHDGFDAEFRKYQEEYLDQMTGTIDIIEQGVLSLAQEKNYRAALRSIKHQVHSLKGSAGSYGFDAISTVCHCFEDQLGSQTLEQRVDDLIDRLLAYTDLLIDCLQKYKSGKIYSTEELAKKLIEVSDHSGNVSAVAKSAPQKSYRVLVVDGSHSTQQCCRAAVKNMNVELSFVPDGYDALGRLLREKFDAVLTSAVVPTLSGQALLNVVGAAGSFNKNITKVLLTSSDLTDASGTGADHVVKKDADFVANIMSLFERMFTVQKPRALTSPPEKQSPAPSALRLLVIDDSEDIHILVRIALKRVAGLEIQFCKSGEKALELIRSFSPTLVLLDVMMPEMDGPTVLKKIRNDATTKSLPVIFLTGKNTESETQELRAHGVSGVICKPFNPKLLYEEILRVAPFFKA